MCLYCLTANDYRFNGKKINNTIYDTFYWLSMPVDEYDEFLITGWM